MQSMLFSFFLCLLPSALFCLMRHDFLFSGSFAVDCLCLAVLLTALLRLWLRVTELERRIDRLSNESQDKMQQ